jgi:hypothetical protein
VAADAGADALQALLEALGEQYLRINELENMLMKKGIMTDKEWDEAIWPRLTDEKRPLAFWVCQDPDHRAALNQFFGVDKAEGGGSA